MHSNYSPPPPPPDVTKMIAMGNKYIQYFCRNVFSISSSGGAPSGLTTTGGLRTGSGPLGMELY